MEKKYYGAVDAIKILCAVMVIIIHTAPFSSVNGMLNSFTVNYLSRIAVPFFFISSGFLLFSKISLSKLDFSAIGMYLKKLLRIYLVWSAVYFPYTLYQMYNMKSVKRVLMHFLGWAKNMVFSAGYGVLWYLMATIVAVAAVSVLLRCGVKIDGVIAIGAVLYAIGLCGQSYYGLAAKLPLDEWFRSAVKAVYNFIGTTRNGVFEGIIFIALGAKLSQRKSFGSVRCSAAGFCVSMVLFLAEFVLVSKMGWHLGYDMYIFLVPSAYFLLRMALGIKPSANPKTPRWLRPCSTLVYLTHMIPVEVCAVVAPKIYANSVLLFATVLAVTAVLVTAILLGSQTKALRFLKYIY